MYFQSTNDGINLQATLSSSSATTEIFRGGPHHPITCQYKLYYEEDGTFRCEHAVAGPDDERTQQVLNHSMAFLLIELAKAL